MSDIGEADYRRIAVEAGVDPRTIKRLLRGQRVLPMTEHRIRAAMAKLGYVEEFVIPIRNRDSKAAEDFARQVMAWKDH